MITLTEEQASKLIPRFSFEHHKGTGGTALLFCGSVGFSGAAALAASACYRSGAGIVRCVLPERIYQAVSTLVPEAVFIPVGRGRTLSPAALRRLKSDKISASAVLIGCGLGRSRAAAALFKKVMSNKKAPIIIDADGLNIASDCIYCIKDHPSTVITPHPGEAARLLGTTVAEIQGDRVAAVKRLARLTDGVALLKGHGTLIAAPDSEVYLCPFGNAGMGKGGSGDVLAGMITSFAAQGMSPLDSALLGTVLHSLAGDAAALDLSENAMLPSDITHHLPEVFKRLK